MKRELHFSTPSYDLFASAREALGSLRDGEGDGYENVT